MMKLFSFRRGLGLLLALGLTLALTMWFAANPAFGQEGDPLDDPLVLGAWLYEGRCVSCHGDYASSRLGQSYYEDELFDKIEGGSGGCQVSWARRLGGPLAKREIEALVLYFLTWEDLGQAPELPALPPQPTPTLEPTPEPKDKQAPPTEAPTPTPAIPPEVQRAIQDNPLALGAWLYTQHCYRCHLSYEYSRQGTGMDKARLKQTIENGKAGTSMTAFARQQGGVLKSSEISAIVTYILAFEQLDAPPALPNVLFVPPTPDPSSLQPIPLPDMPWVKGDGERGAAQYAVHCQACHGPQGSGEIGPRLAKPWPSARPDLTVQATIRDGVPGTLMRAWGQVKGGPLSNEQIADLTTAILLWSDQHAPVAPSAQAAGLPGWWWLLPGAWGGLLAMGFLRKAR